MGSPSVVKEDNPINMCNKNVFWCTPKVYEEYTPSGVQILLSGYLSRRRKDGSDMDVTRSICHNRISLAKNMTGVRHNKEPL